MTPRERRKANERARVAKRRTSRATRGVVLMRVLHDDGCNAPLFPCTCRPQVVVHTNPSAERLADAFATQADHVASIKRGLS